MLKLKSFKGGYDTNLSYILYDDQTKEAAVIDTAIEPSILLAFIEKQHLSLKFVVIMHSHFDHVVGYGYYGKNTIPVAASHRIRKDVDINLKDGDTLRLGNYPLDIMETPGHIYDCICIFVEDNKNNKLFTTDCLFIDGCGRCDLAGANVEEQYHSLYNKIMKLPDDTVIYPGHDYGPKPYDTLGNQKKTNRFLTAKTKEEFIEGRMRR